MGISREQALDCFRSDDLVGIGMEADAVRSRLHPEGVVSYAVEHRVHCGPPNGAAAGFVERVCDEVGSAVEWGATGVRLTGGTATLESWQEVLSGVRQRFPAISLAALSPADVIAISRDSALASGEVLGQLRDAGLDLLADDGDGLVGLEAWLEVHRAAHQAGMRTAATMVFGAGETAEQRVEWLEAIGRLQEETGGFTAFVPVSAEPPNGRDLDGVTAVDRLKTLAISRMFLDSIEHVQASAAGLKVLQMGLRFGANDLGPTDTRDGTPGEDLRRVIRDAGFSPAQRDSLYRMMFLN